MTAVLLLIVSLIYLGVAISYYIQGNLGMMLAFAAYAVSNIGIYLGAK